MIDLNQEEILSLSEACAALPQIEGKRPHISTLWRWCNRGIRGVRLEHVRLGHRMCTSREALNRFLNALTADSERSAVSTPGRPVRSPEPQRLRAIAEAESALGEEGI